MSGHFLTISPLDPLCLFVQTSPINLLEWAETEIDSLDKIDMFNVQINLDRHNHRLKFNYCLLFDPPLFSLLSTFNKCHSIGLDI
jgi:hypothetical protein